MQKFLFFMLIYLTVASTGFGRECVHENSMSAIRGCLRDLSNTELRNVYHNVFSKIESVEARAALQKSQLEFVEYRQHSCSVVAETTKHLGWISEDQISNCVIMFNTERIAFLSSLLASGDNY